jgi:hypothetical protein
MVESRRALIKDAFADFECSDDAVWDSAVALADYLHMQPTELSEKYELFAINQYGSLTSPTCSIHNFALVYFAFIFVQEEAGREHHTPFL